MEGAATKREMLRCAGERAKGLKMGGEKAKREESRSKYGFFFPPLKVLAVSKIFHCEKEFSPLLSAALRQFQLAVFLKFGFCDMLKYMVVVLCRGRSVQTNTLIECHLSCVGILHI